MEQRSTDDKQNVVAFIQREFDRNGLTMDDESFFVAQTPDAAKRPLDEQPWLMRAELAEGNPYTFCLMMDGARADGATILRPHSDAVWFIELFRPHLGHVAA